MAAWWPAFVLALASIWVVQPMHDVNWWQSHENIWYPVRVHEYLLSWDAGVWYPRWCPNFYGGYGYPFLNYYAPGVYFFGALISRIASVDPFAALKLLVTLATMTSSFGVYGLLRSETRRTDAALLGAACYVFLPYRCTDLFARGDLAEYCAYCVVPFVVWSYRALARSSGRRAALIACAAALSHACVLLSHTLLGMLTTDLVGLYAVALCLRKQHRIALLAGAAMLFGIAIASVYLLPAFAERNLVFIERVTDGNYVPWQRFVPLGSLLDPFYTPGWAFFLGLAGWLASLAVPRARRAAIASAIPWLVAVAMLVVSFPHIVLIWKVIPFGGKVQFAWRLLGYVGLFTALGIAIWWAQLVPPRWYAMVAAIVLCLPMPALLSAQRRVVLEPVVPMTDAQIRATFATSTAMDEYLPRRVGHAPPGPVTRPAWGDDVSVRVAGRQLDGLHHEVEIDTPGPSRVTVPVFGFRGWQVRTLEGPVPAELRVDKDDGLVRVLVPKAGHYKVVVYFGQVWFRVFAAVLSVLALLALYPVLALLAWRLSPAGPATALAAG